jgi:hypothetical protein
MESKLGVMLDSNWLFGITKLPALDIRHRRTATE